MSEPRTIAGRALLGWVRPGRTREWWADRLAAVEREAAALGEGETAALGEAEAASLGDAAQEAARFDESSAARAAARVIHARLLGIDPDRHADAGADSCPDCEETARLVTAAILEAGDRKTR